MECYEEIVTNIVEFLNGIHAKVTGAPTKSNPNRHKHFLELHFFINVQLTTAEIKLNSGDCKNTNGADVLNKFAKLYAPSAQTYIALKTFGRFSVFSGSLERVKKYVRADFAVLHQELESIRVDDDCTKDIIAAALSALNEFKGDAKKCNADSQQPKKQLDACLADVAQQVKNYFATFVPNQHARCHKHPDSTHTEPIQRILKAADLEKITVFIHIPTHIVVVGLKKFADLPVTAEEDIIVVPKPDDDGSDGNETPTPITDSL